MSDLIEGNDPEAKALPGWLDARCRACGAYVFVPAGTPVEVFSFAAFVTKHWPCREGWDGKLGSKRAPT